MVGEGCSGLDLYTPVETLEEASRGDSEMADGLSCHLEFQARREPLHPGTDSGTPRSERFSHAGDVQAGRTGELIQLYLMGYAELEEVITLLAPRKNKSLIR